MKNSFNLAMGLEYEDVKMALIANDEVVDSKQYSLLLRDYGILLAICYEAKKGNLNASKYLEDGAILRFKDFVPDKHKENVLKQTNQFLGNNKL